MATKSTTKKETAQEAAPETVTETVQAPPAPPQGEEETLGIQDLQTTAQIISICSARGAFKAEEMEQVGKLFNKLNKFLQQAAEAQGAAEDQG